MAVATTVAVVVAASEPRRSCASALHVFLCERARERDGEGLLLALATFPVIPAQDKGFISRLILLPASKVAMAVTAVAVAAAVVTNPRAWLVVDSQNLSSSDS